MNQIPPSESSHPAGASEPESPNSTDNAPPAERAERPAPASYEELDREMSAPRGTAEEAPGAETIPAETPPPPPRFPPTPPPLPSFGAPQSPPRPAPPQQRASEHYVRPAQQPGTQPPTEQPHYPPRIPAPQPAPPGTIAEPPRPYEGGRYIPPPPTPPSGPAVPGRDWSGANTATVQQAPQETARVAPRGNPQLTSLLGIIAVLLLALTVLQGINTFRPKAAPPMGVQQVQVQRQTVKPETATEIKDTIDKAQAALNQFNQDAPTSYAGATTDAQRQAVLLQSMIFLQQIIAQQNNDLLLVYRDLNT